MFSLRRLAAGVLIVSCVAVRTADAAPITYLYTATASAASADPDLQALIPPGSPATILLTVDPAVNLIAGNPNFPPSFADAGLYRFDAVLDFTGRGYAPWVESLKSIFLSASPPTQKPPLLRRRQWRVRV